MLDISALTKKNFPITELLWTIGIFLVLFFASVVGNDPFGHETIRFVSVAPGKSISNSRQRLRNRI